MPCALSLRSPFVLGVTLTVVLIIVSLGTLLGAALWWRARCSSEVRRVAVAIRELLQEVVTSGGLAAPDFLTEERRRDEQELEDLTDRVNDGKLRSECRRLLEAYRKTWASAPPAIGPRVYVVGRPDPPAYIEEDRRYMEQTGREVEHAREALVLLNGVLARVNQLERFLPRRD